MNIKNNNVRKVFLHQGEFEQIYLLENSDVLMTFEQMEGNKFFPP